MQPQLDRMIVLMEQILSVLELQETSKTTRRQKARKQNDLIYTEEIGYLWDAYPRKNNKRSAAQAYHRAVEELEKTREFEGEGVDTPHEYLVCRAIQYNAAWSPARLASEGDYRQHASTWLNQGSYLHPEAWGGFAENVQRGPKWEPTQG